MSHTEEKHDWLSQCPVCLHPLVYRTPATHLNADALNAAVIKNMQGCAGLNPAAYGECVTALEAVEKYVPREGSDYCKLQQALLHATQEASS